MTPPTTPRPRQRQTPKVQRWIDLLAALLRRRFGLPFEELVAEVPAYAAAPSAEARSRMFERDKKELRELGVPIETVSVDDGEGALYRLRATDFYLPYLSVVGPDGPSRPRQVNRDGYRALRRLAFEPDELLLVAEAAARVRQLGDPALASDAASAMRKLAFDLPLGATEVPADTHVARPRAAADPETLAELGAALRARKTVTFDYHAMSGDAPARRAAQPYGLFFLGGHWYLVAHDTDRSALRNFRVSRIAALATNRAREGTPDYAIPADFSLPEHARSRGAWELGDGGAEAAVVEFRGETGAAHAAARLGEPAGDDPRRRRFQVRRRDAFARWLLSFAGEAVPISPPELVADVRRLARETLALYGGPA